MKKSMEYITHGKRPVILFHGFAKICFNRYAMRRYLGFKEDQRIEEINELAIKLKNNKTRGKEV